MITELDLPDIHPTCRLCVTVPAKDEEQFITRTLDALRKQLDFNDSPLDSRLYEVIVLANNCTDATATVVENYATAHPGFALHLRTRHFPCAHAHVGTARKLTMDAASERLPADGIICTTDADTLVDRYWVAAILRAFERGATAVGGRITVPKLNERPGNYRKIYLQDVTYRMLRARLESLIDPDPEDPWPRHFQEYGPSTAVSVAAYRACGGMPAVGCIEDVAFGLALERTGVNFVHDNAVRVRTSARVSHRIEGVSFGRALDEWDRMEREARQPVVFGLDNCLRLFNWKVALRRAYTADRPWLCPELESLARYLQLSDNELIHQIVRAPTFGALYQDIRQVLERTHEFSDATFGRAITDLRRFFRVAKHRCGTAEPALVPGD